MNTAIQIADLSYRYHDGTEALRGLSFNVAQGECVALLGPNGSGKSTLLLHLNGLLPEKLGLNGAVRILGQPITPDNLDTIRRQVGLVFQDPDDQLFCPSVEEDVAFGPQQLGLSDAEVSARVQKALSDAKPPRPENFSPPRWRVNRPLFLSDWVLSSQIVSGTSLL